MEKKVVKEIIRLDDDDKEVYEKFVLSDNDAKEYFNEEDMNVGSKIESKIEKEDGVWMHTQKQLNILMKMIWMKEVK